MATVILYTLPRNEGVIEIRVQETENETLYFPFVTYDFNMSGLKDDCIGSNLGEVVSKLKKSFGAIVSISRDDLAEWELYLRPDLEDGRRIVSLKKEYDCTEKIRAGDLRSGDLVFNGAQSFFRFWKGEASRIYYRTRIFELV